MSAAAAVWRGTLTVNGTVMLTMFGIPALACVAAFFFHLGGYVLLAVMVVAFVVNWPLGWLVWSVLVPRWRVWAYERVDDLDELEWRGVAAGLIWPKGHFFERTEIHSRDQKQRIHELERAWDARRGSGPAH